MLKRNQGLVVQTSFRDCSRAHPARDNLGELVFDGERVARAAVEGTGPNVKPIIGGDQLRVAPKSISGMTQAAFQNQSSVQLFANLAGILRAVLKLENRST